MLLSTRDAQLEKQSTQLLGAIAAADRRLTLAGISNASFRSDSIPDLRLSSRSSSQSGIQLRVPSRSPSQSESQLRAPSRSENQSRIASRSGTVSEPLTTIVDVPEVPEERTTTSDAKQETPREKRRYHWKMTHYFYIHISLFIVNGFLCGLIVYLIENYSSSRNRQIQVAYIDAWFVSSSCVYNCGLTTLDFAKLSVTSQVILMVFTFISGITISTLPALIVKAHTHKKVEGITVDDDHGDLEDEINDELPTISLRRRRNLPQHIRNRLASLPTAAQLRYRAYITCIALTLGTCFTIYSITFTAIGGWLTTQYTSEQLLQGNSSINPWYISFIVTITGFNQNGLTPFSDGFSRFVNDVFLNLFVMLVVSTGTSLFPFLLRNVVLLARFLSPFRHKVVFDYILMNNHRLSTLLFPAVQTRIYLLVTMLLYILGISISLILDLHGPNLAMYPPGTRVLIFFFQTVNTRFAGFQTVDISLFATATLVVYLLLMATKPQMLCAVDESPFELSWLALQAREEVDAQTNPGVELIDTSNLPLHSPSDSFSPPTSDSALPMRHMERFLRRQSFVTKDRARQQFANTVIVNGARHKPQNLRKLRIRLFLIYFARSLIKHTFSFVILTRTWLFFFIFLICAIENRRMSPVDPNITIFKIIFEIISAFGAVGLTLGYPGIASSFATVLSPASKTILVITMLMGRHRGLLASMKDQEAIEHSAADLLTRRREEIIYEYEKSNLNTDPVHETSFDERIVRF